MVYRYCIVPGCKSTTIATPGKTFIKLPIEEKRRKIWIKAIRRHPEDISSKSNVYLCDDHFSLQQDMENYMEWKIMGVQKRMKKNVVPHIFACQEDRKRTCPKPERMAVVKRARQSIIQDVLCEASTSKSGLPLDLPTQQEFTPALSNIDENVDKKRTIGVQVNLRNKYRSNSIQCNIYPCTVCRGSSPICHPTKSVALSPIRFLSVRRQIYSSSESSASEFTVSSSSDYSDSNDSELDEVISKDNKQDILKFTFGKIKANPRLYLGVMSETFFIIIDIIIQKNLQVDVDSIYLVLQKIRLDKTFQELADDFGISESNASRIFDKTVNSISNILKNLIVWFSVEKVKKCLPLPFRARYSNVYAIIDCFEIEIQKPEDPVKQALTWSEYKKANTMKYLISSTPDGLITFISNGFGGRTSDALIVEKSGFLDKLQPNMHIMADRGFKHIDNMLAERKCKLVRPPSVASGSKLSRAEVLQTKKIASLRIHIERVIRRLREFKMLRPHACIHIKLISQLDSIINIACALVNTQGPLIS